MITVSSSSVMLFLHDEPGIAWIAVPVAGRDGDHGWSRAGFGAQLRVPQLLTHLRALLNCDRSIHDRQAGDVVLLDFNEAELNNRLGRWSMLPPQVWVMMKCSVGA